MTGASVSTRLATVLFLDIVGSTDLASELGDERWRELLARFRHTVRVDLRAYKGHEEDTAGDGFFATFASPVAAIRCAAAIVHDVHAVGVDVRCGIHSGDVGSVEKRTGGIAVHVAARVMALAGPAEILCTTTVRDLVLGSDMVFEVRGRHELKGVPGEWEIVAIRGIPDPVKAPLGEEEKAERLASIQPRPLRRRRAAVIGGAVTLAIVAVAGLLAVRDSGSGPAPPPALVRIDPRTNEVVQTIGTLPDQDQNYVFAAVDGSLWQRSGVALIRRSDTDGTQQLRIEPGYPALRFFPTAGFGSAWTYMDVVFKVASRGTGELRITRYDGGSGRAHPYTVPGASVFHGPGALARAALSFGAFVAGRDGVWYLSGNLSGNDTTLSLIDPTGSVRHWATGPWLAQPTEVLPVGDSVWLCAPYDYLIARFDIASHEVADRLPNPGGDCPVAVAKDEFGINTIVWVLDRTGEILQGINARTGKAGEAISIETARSAGPVIGPTAFAFGSIWLPIGSTLYRFDVASQTMDAIPMPAGVTVGSVVADERSGTVWAANCNPQECAWMPRS